MDVPVYPSSFAKQLSQYSLVHLGSALDTSAYSRISTENNYLMSRSHSIMSATLYRERSSTWAITFVSTCSDTQSDDFLFDFCVTIVGRWQQNSLVTTPRSSLMPCLFTIIVFEHFLFHLFLVSARLLLCVAAAPNFRSTCFSYFGTLANDYVAYRGGDIVRQTGRHWHTFTMFVAHETTETAKKIYQWL